MPLTDHKQIIESILKGDLKPFYVLHGDEPYFIDLICNTISNNAIPEGERGFNQQILYGKDVTVSNILNYARSFPMMGAKQVVIVKEAQEIPKLFGKDTAELSANINLLNQYFQNPQESTVLVLCIKNSLDSRKNWVKAIEKKGISYQSKKLYENQVADWLSNYAKALNLKINRNAAQIVVEFIGNNLSRIATEMDKLAVNIKPNEEITPETIERFVGINKDYNVFEWQKAIASRNIKKSFAIGFYLADNQKEMPLTMNLVTLFNYFLKIMLIHASKDKSETAVASIAKVHPFFVKDYLIAVHNFSMAHCANVVHQIKTADLHLKGIERGSRTDKEIVQELIFNILA